MSELREESRAKVRAACKQFFDSLDEADLHDHPEVFQILDEYARTHNYAICAEQKGIFGTILSFKHLDHM